MMKKFPTRIALVYLFLSVSIFVLASPDRIGNEGRSFISDALGIIFTCIIGLPIAIMIVKEWISGNMKDDNATGCVALAVIIAFILYIFIKCS